MITAIATTRGPPGPALVVMAGGDGKLSAYDWTRNLVTDLGPVAGKDTHASGKRRQTWARVRPISTKHLTFGPAFHMAYSLTAAAKTVTALAVTPDFSVSTGAVFFGTATGPGRCRALHCADVRGARLTTCTRPTLSTWSRGF